MIAETAAKGIRFLDAGWFDFFLSFPHSKQLQSAKFVFCFLALAAGQRIGNPRVVWFVPIRFADGERKGCRELECESHPKMLFLCRF